MLILTRRPGERVVLNVGHVTITVMHLYTRGSQTRLGFDAPPGVEILRGELLDRMIGDELRGPLEPGVTR